MQRPSKIVCVGRNYAAHAAELNNPLPSEPLLFIKPPSSLAQLPDVTIPTASGSCHHELEIAVRVGETLRAVSPTAAAHAVDAATLALDLTLRDLQDKLKQQGHPWERAKAFDGACVLAPWVAVADLDAVQRSTFTLRRNGQLQQQGDGTQMLMPIAELLAHISHTFTLEAGDVVLTGTPAGVGPLLEGDKLELSWQLGNTEHHWQGQVKTHD
ncbi:fumarylacetoacetate hydrolase family protein [Pseudidiomarina insulisalsae]|uniref:Fumarylacetoacetate hydrolase n=1 Tax=Pseudidiomarina insulisalsae TaxID=575789 RepID=A0A432YF03_9GAMM|nr:fumarylacetoacetate hydrolase family protein [Pseudidiomarina insulisalsae]RUO59532.1 fumarylacetoacetate hydrolase [Pseudidiomarina insulisalsae]